jgi:hypothetical protein
LIAIATWGVAGFKKPAIYETNALSARGWYVFEWLCLPQPLSWVILNKLCIVSRRCNWYSLAMFDTMDSDLEAVIEGADILISTRGRELECLTLDKGHAGKVVVADILEIVGHFAMIAMLSVTVPARHNLPIVEHLEKVGGIWWVRGINGILKPDLRPWVDGDVAGCY